MAKRQTQPPQKRPPSRHGGLSPPGCTILVCARPPHQPRALARFAKRPRHRSHTPTFPGSSPGASTTLSRSSMAEHPADNRKTAVRYRAGEPTTGDRHDRTNRAACRRTSIADGPGAFKPESVGQRAFNPRARGSTPPGSSNPRSRTRLAQSVERRPLKSEVRGSSPRSCTKSIGLLRIC